MIFNSFIFGLLDVGAGIDQSGDPVPTASTWGNGIRCHIVRNTNSNKGSNEEGRFKMSSYDIYVPGEFKADRIKLTELDGTEIGEFEVKSLQPLKLVNRTKIIV